MAEDFSQIPLGAPKPSAHGFFVPRYWRGDFSPAMSIGVFGILGCVVRLVAGFAIAMGLYTVFAFGSGQGLILSLIVLGAADCAVALWQIVGLWRSTVRSGGAAIAGAVAATCIILFTSAVALANTWNSVHGISAQY